MSALYVHTSLDTRFIAQGTADPVKLQQRLARRHRQLRPDQGPVEVTDLRMVLGAPKDIASYGALPDELAGRRCLSVTATLRQLPVSSQAGTAQVTSGCAGVGSEPSIRASDAGRSKRKQSSHARAGAEHGAQEEAEEARPRSRNLRGAAVVP